MESEENYQNQWKIGLCNCHKTPCLSLLFVFCPMCTILYSTYVNLIHSGLKSQDAILRSLGTCIAYIFCAALSRQKIREFQNIKGDLLEDFCTHAWCACCAQIQEYQQVQKYPWERQHMK